jgi:hypothetical protein
MRQNASFTEIVDKQEELNRSAVLRGKSYLAFR